jgi:4a-hydroxytetrahydrobiopterin dehydratase
MEKWPIVNEQLEKEFEFQDFLKAVNFINKVSEFAEDVDHHPDLFLHSYNKVRVSMMTHSEGKITQKDHELALKIDSILISKP